MKRMKLFLGLSFCLVLNAISGQVNAGDAMLEKHLKEIDGLTLKEITAKYNRDVEDVKNFMEFFLDDDSDKLLDVRKEDEVYEDSFAVDTTGVTSAIGQFKKVVFKQYYFKKKTNLEFAFVPERYFGAQRLGEGITDIYTPRKIYYKNGNVVTEGVANNEFSFHFQENWGKPSVIDSVLIDFEIMYAKQYDSVVLSLSSPKVAYKGGVIELLELDRNYGSIRISNDINGLIDTQGQNIEGKTLNNFSSSKAIQPIEKRADLMKLMLSYLEDVQLKLNKNHFDSVKQLKEYIRLKLKDFDVFKTDGFNYHDGFYSGNLDQLTLFFAVENEHLKTTFTAVNTNLNYPVIQHFVDKDLVFVGKKEKPLFTIKNKTELFEALNPWFYKDDNHYYFLNIKKKRLDTLNVFEIKDFNNGLVSIQQNENSEFINLYYNKSKPTSSSSKYEYLTEYNDLLIGQKGANFYVIDQENGEKPLVGVANIVAGGDEYLIIENVEGLKGYLNNKGETIVPMQYKGVNKFSEGLAHVENKDGLFGFIDEKGKLVLPHKYDSAYGFVNGVTAVDFDGSFKLIDKKGNVILNSNTKGISIVTTNDIRVYRFGDKAYNSYGEPIVE